MNRISSELRSSNTISPRFPHFPAHECISRAKNGANAHLVSVCTRSVCWAGNKRGVLGFTKSARVDFKPRYGCWISGEHKLRYLRNQWRKKNFVNWLNMRTVSVYFQPCFWFIFSVANAHRPCLLAWCKRSPLRVANARPKNLQCSVAKIHSESLCTDSFLVVQLYSFE